MIIKDHDPKNISAVGAIGVIALWGLLILFSVAMTALSVLVMVLGVKWLWQNT